MQLQQSGPHFWRRQMRHRRRRPFPTRTTRRKRLRLKKTTWFLPSEPSKFAVPSIVGRMLPLAVLTLTERPPPSKERKVDVPSALLEDSRRQADYHAEMLLAAEAEVEEEGQARADYEAAAALAMKEVASASAVLQKEIAAAEAAVEIKDGLKVADGEIMMMDEREPPVGGYKVASGETIKSLNSLQYMDRHGHTAEDQYRKYTKNKYVGKQIKASRTDEARADDAEEDRLRPTVDYEPSESRKKYNGPNPRLRDDEKGQEAARAAIGRMGAFWISLRAA